MIEEVTEGCDGDPGLGFGSRFQTDRGTQLIDRGDLGQLRVMLIRSRTRPRRDNTDLIQRQSTLPHTLHATRKRLQPTRDRADRVGVGR